MKIEAYSELTSLPHFQQGTGALALCDILGSSTGKLQ